MQQYQEHLSTSLPQIPDDVARHGPRTTTGRIPGKFYDF